METDKKTEEPVNIQVYPDVFAAEDMIVDGTQKYLDREIRRKKIPLSADRAITLLYRKRFRKVENLGVLEKGLLDDFMLNDPSFKGIFRRDNLLAELYEDSHWTNIPNTTGNFAKIRFRNMDGTYVREHCFCGGE